MLSAPPRGCCAGPAGGPRRRALAGAATAAIAELSGSTPGLERQPDPRLGPALDYIRAHLADTVQLRDVAAAVALSESRFRHLFVAETGSSFRAYVLWLRINLAVEAALSGATGPRPRIWRASRIPRT